MARLEQRYPAAGLLAVDARVAVVGQTGDQHRERAPAALQSELGPVPLGADFRWKIGDLRPHLDPADARRPAADNTPFPAPECATPSNLTVRQPEGVKLDHVTRFQSHLIGVGDKQQARIGLRRRLSRHAAALASASARSRPVPRRDANRG